MALNNCPQKTISSNLTTLSYAIEDCLGQLPVVPIWKPLEPNSIDSFGATLTNATRTPIGTGRQRIKGEVVDLEAAVGYTSDLTSENHQDFIKGFLLANPRELPVVNNAVSANAIVSTTTNTTVLAAGAGVAFAAGDIVMAEGFGAAGNNGIRVVTSFASNTITWANNTGGVEAAVPATAKLVVVGRQFEAAAISLASGNRLLGTGIAAAMAGIQRGDWIYIGGATPTTVLTGFKGFARVGSISADSITLDRVLGDWATDAGTGKTVQIFRSISIRNPALESDMNLWSFQFEQTLGRDADGAQSRYVMGAMANEFTLTVPSADKVTSQFSFAACDEEARTGATGLKEGTRPALETYPMFNSSRAANKIWLHKAGDAKPLFAYATNATVTINNGMTGVKAIGVTGNLDINVGTFEVGGSITAYFLDVRAIQAMRQNADVGGTVALTGNNVGVIFDMPRMGLSNGQTAIEPNTPVTIALDMEAVRNDLGYTMQYSRFPYLP